MLAALFLSALIDWLSQRMVLLRSRDAMLRARDQAAVRERAAVRWTG